MRDVVAVLGMFRPIYVICLPLLLDYPCSNNWHLNIFFYLDNWQLTTHAPAGKWISSNHLNILLSLSYYYKKYCECNNISTVLVKQMINWVCAYWTIRLFETSKIIFHILCPVKCSSRKNQMNRPKQWQVWLCVVEIFKINFKRSVNSLVHFRREFRFIQCKRTTADGVVDQRRLCQRLHFDGRHRHHRGRLSTSQVGTENQKVRRRFLFIIFICSPVMPNNLLWSWKTCLTLCCYVLIWRDSLMSTKSKQCIKDVKPPDLWINHGNLEMTCIEGTETDGEEPGYSKSRDERGGRRT